MIAKNISIEDISEMTGLSKQDIEKLFQNFAKIKMILAIQIFFDIVIYFF